MSDCNRLFRQNNLLVEPNFRREVPQQPFYLPVQETRDCRTEFIFDSPLSKLIVNKSKKMHHLVCFVHGFQAYSLDMDSLRSHIKYLFPTCETFLSTCNEGKTESALEEQGQRLALELKNLLNQYSTLKNLHISFVCHSMGNLVLRAALPYLSFFSANFLYIVSLSGPHLGYL